MRKDLSVLAYFSGGVKFDKTIGFPIDWEAGLRYEVRAVDVGHRI
jgi:hypothetical protein